MDMVKMVLEKSLGRNSGGGGPNISSPFDVVTSSLVPPNLSSLIDNLPLPPPQQIQPQQIQHPHNYKTIRHQPSILHDKGLIGDTSSIMVFNEVSDVITVYITPDQNTLFRKKIGGEVGISTNGVKLGAQVEFDKNNHDIDQIQKILILPGESGTFHISKNTFAYVQVFVYDRNHNGDIDVLTRQLKHGDIFSILNKHIDAVKSKPYKVYNQDFEEIATIIPQPIHYFSYNHPNQNQNNQNNNYHQNNHNNNHNNQNNNNNNNNSHVNTHNNNNNNNQNDHNSLKTLFKKDSQFNDRHHQNQKDNHHEEQVQQQQQQQQHHHNQHANFGTHKHRSNTDGSYDGSNHPKHHL
ncbi:hypothetical protein DFA_02830 [Cavenderia fasciculata]|uniref:Uncharacterized protein n=1 Tax=Cavenderia fasciculata TaxID=261658 RepID=F4PIK7_CACFS|nr:uncharacterized protein DFA_02830 [Cavenderia fasciculata]EGG24587.1 hypothetical protein DFA_02830 [Cavenderia fasciculata]|eukprot:XP_004362438.1 hypothetical protein DFA_02830 [Cavenderia fasciculata]